MGFHTFDIDNADRLDSVSRLEFLSVDELLALFDSEPDDVVADLGSGTGFYTDYVAPYVGTLYAVDVQPEMHEFYREKGVPENVSLVTAEVADLPFEDDSLDAVFSTMTFHEFADIGPASSVPDRESAALTELARVVRPGGVVATGDWSAAGDGQLGPSHGERLSLADARKGLEANGFVVEYGSERRETFVCSARREDDE